MALRVLRTSATGSRSTDHRDEINLLLRSGQREDGDELHRLACLAAAELLASHDETGLSLDDWDAPRALVEHLLGAPVLRNGV